MANEKHECVIGWLHRCEWSELVTLGELEEHIADNIMYNVMLDADPVLKECEFLRRKEWMLVDYGDRRKNTDLTRFDYCPECGKAIDWKAIRWMRYG